MLLTIKFWNKQEFLPTKRHRNIRTRYFENFIDVDITEPNEMDFPIAFIVHDFQSVCDGEHYVTSADHGAELDKTEAERKQRAELREAIIRAFKELY